MRNAGAAKLKNVIATGLGTWNQLNGSDHIPEAATGTLIKSPGAGAE